MTGSARGGRSTTGRAAATKKTTPPKQDPDFVYVNTNDLTAGEIEAVEESSGVSIAHYGQMDKAQGPISRAIGWVFRLRTDPDIVYEDKNCGRGVRPQCGDCHCARRLKVLYLSEAPTPPSGGNGSAT
jgi:hypothetical protein